MYDETDSARYRTTSNPLAIYPYNQGMHFQMLNHVNNLKNEIHDGCKHGWYIPVHLKTISFKDSLDVWFSKQRYEAIDEKCLCNEKITKQFKIQNDLQLESKKKSFKRNWQGKLSQWTTENTLFHFDIEITVECK